DVARNRDGNLGVSDSGTLRIVLINPSTGQQTVLAEGTALGGPFGRDVDQQNRIYVANSRAILSASPNSSVQTVADGGPRHGPLDVAVASDGSLYVADALAGVVRVDPVSKQQTLVSQGGLLHTATGITLDGNHTAYVVDAGGRCVVAVDTQRGS